MDEVRKEILDAVEALKKRLPENLYEECLLTGGAAAFLYGSDRPFSHDMDFMVPREQVGDFESALGLRFEHCIKKPVFHSYKGVFEENGQSFDLIAESVIEPEEEEFCCKVCLTEEIRKRKVTLEIDGKKVRLIPRELLVLIKVLAGRGQELGKFDLYDAKKILENSPDFDSEFFRGLACAVCVPPENMLPALKKNAGKVGDIRLVEALKSLQQCE